MVVELSGDGRVEIVGRGSASTLSLDDGLDALGAELGIQNEKLQAVGVRSLQTFLAIREVAHTIWLRLSVALSFTRRRWRTNGGLLETKLHLHIFDQLGLPIDSLGHLMSLQRVRLRKQPQSLLFSLIIFTVLFLNIGLELQKTLRLFELCRDLGDFIL